jgi:hypothetical protein
VTVDVQTTGNMPGPVPALRGLKVEIAGDATTPILTWEPQNRAGAYLVQYRQSGQAVWVTGSDPVAGFAPPSYRASYPKADLDYATTYEFRSAGVVDGRLGPWTNISTVTTGGHIPTWSDLVASDGGGEIDITKVQMLVFTVLAALFVTLKIGDDSAIPTIPDGMIILMGLSNGVYVGGKFVFAQR